MCRLIDVLCLKGAPHAIAVARGGGVTDVPLSSQLPTLALASTMTSRTSAAVASAGCQIRCRGLGRDHSQSR
jgi:hypothetical protein